MAGKVGAFHAELQVQIAGDEARARLRRQLPSNIFVQSLAGPREVRTGIIGLLLRLIVQVSLVAGPIALLVLFQLQFLPYHEEWITSWQRIAVVIDLILLWILWPPIARGETARLGWNDFKRTNVLAWLSASVLPILLVFIIATFPGEWLEKNLPTLWIPTNWPPWKAQTTEPQQKRWTSLHELLVAGRPDYVTGKPRSLWSNVLVLPNFGVGDRVKFDAEGKIAISSEALSLRARSLEGAVLVGAHLRKADFTGAQLTSANLIRADLHEAKFECDQAGDGERECAQLQGALLDVAQLQGASLKGAQLQGARLDGAELQGAWLDHAELQGGFFMQTRLQGASLDGVQLQGAHLYFAQLQGASLDGAELQSAWLDHAELQGALLDHAELQGAFFSSDAQLHGASLRNVYVWRAQRPPVDNLEGVLIDTPVPGPTDRGLNCPAPTGCPWTKGSYAALKSLIENRVPAGFLRAQALKRIAMLERPPDAQDDVGAKAWADLAEISSRSAKSYPETLARTLEAIGCDADGAPYVISGLIAQLDARFRDSPAQVAEVAAAFLDEAKCAGARRLSEENKAKLREIRDRAVVRAGPSAAAR